MIFVGLRSGEGSGIDGRGSVKGFEGGGGTWFGSLKG